jgi:hypothetical protein
MTVDLFCGHPYLPRKGYSESVLKIRLFAVFSGIEMALVHPCVLKAVFNPNGIASFSPGLARSMRAYPG